MLWTDLTDGSLRDVFVGRAVIEDCACGAVILQAGDIADRIYLILRGSVEVRVVGDRGTGLLLHRLGRGDFFGEMAFFHPQGTHPVLRRADVSSRAATRVASLDYGTFTDLTREYPALLAELACQLAQRLHRANRWRLDLDSR